MSKTHQLKETFKNYYKNGFFLDRNTFLKADDADIMMVRRKDDDGKLVQRSMMVLKNVCEMMVDRNGKIVAVENKKELAVWITAVENALKRFNKDLSLD